VIWTVRVCLPECAVFNSAPNLPRSYKTLSIGLRKALFPSHLTEEILHHLEGYSGSYPVLIGNNAYNQLQLDISGELMDSVYLYNKYATRLRTTCGPSFDG